MRSRARLNNCGAIVGTATYTPTGTTDPIAVGSHGVLLAPISVIQNNYPTTAGVEDLGPTGTQTIIGPGGAGIAYITGAPAMPQVTAQVMGFGSSSGLNVNWRLLVTSERSERGDQDDIDIPYNLAAEGAPIGGPDYVVNLPINQAWNMFDPTASSYPVPPYEFFGGNVTLYFTIKDSVGNVVAPEQSVTFKIRGKNPMPSAAYAYIQTEPQCGSTGNLYYAWGIAKHESFQDPNTYCQFNSANFTRNPKELPQWGSPNGWGIFQRDDSGGGVTVTTDQVYSWEANSDVCVTEELIPEWNEANHYLAGIQSHHQTAPSPPSYTASGKTFAAIDVLTMERYNGAGRFTHLLHFNSSSNTWTWNLPNAPSDTEPYVNRVAEQMVTTP